MPYQAAKAGLATMALYLAHELGPHKIAVNVLLPGHTRTTGSDEQEAERQRLAERQGGPVRRPIRVRPEHVVPLALHLAEQDASTLSDAFDLALELRIAHHIEQLAAGRAADDHVEPATISPLVRDHLRDVFRAVAGVQRRLRG